jgi:hypothetical protein
MSKRQPKAAEAWFLVRDDGTPVLGQLCRDEDEACIKVVQLAAYSGIVCRTVRYTLTPTRKPKP